MAAVLLGLVVTCYVNIVIIILLDTTSSGSMQLLKYWTSRYTTQIQFRDECRLPFCADVRLFIVTPASRISSLVTFWFHCRS